MIGKLYASTSTEQGSSTFETIPFNNASIDWNREEASTMSFKSPIELPEATRIRYNSENGSFGGQIYNVKHDTNGYSYDVISYLRLYHDKVTCSYSNLSSSQIIKKVLKKSKNNFRTSGITNTTPVHSYLKWENTSIWDIACQLCWLEHKAGYECRCSVDSEGTLIFGYTSEAELGYTFNTSFDYTEEYDSSDFITASNITYNGSTLLTTTSNKDLILKWGYVTENTDCESSTTSTKTSSSGTTQSTSLKDTSQISKYNITSSVVNQALSIAKTSNTEYSNLKLLYKWCDEKIDYQSYSNTRYGAKGTLSKRKGNCCDNAHLLIAMARSIGIKARYCHAHRNGKGHVWGQYYVNKKWFTCDTGVNSTGNYWGSHSNYAGSATNTYDTLPF